MAMTQIHIAVPQALALATRHVLLDRKETLSEALRPAVIAEMERIIAHAERPREMSPEGADDTERVAPRGAADPILPRARSRRRREEIPR